MTQGGGTQRVRIAALFISTENFFFLKQETLPSLLCTGWLPEWNQASSLVRYYQNHSKLPFLSIACFIHTSVEP